jgi:hypothetical protein
MKCLLVRLLIVLSAFILGLCAYSGVASKHAELWKKDESRQVYFNGRVSAGSAVYRRADGLHLLRTAEDGAWYVYGDDGLLSYCKSFDEWNRRVFAVRVPGYVYTWRRDAYQCFHPASSIDRPEILVAPGAIEFNSLDYNRIKLSW